MAKIREGSGGVQGHGHKQRLQDEGRGDVHIRAAQAWTQRLLRQALGVGSNISTTSARVSSGVPNTEKQMKARGRFGRVLLLFRGVWSP